MVVILAGFGPNGFDLSRVVSEAERLIQRFEMPGESGSGQGPIEGTVGVVDGDTLAIGSDRIRLYGIDAPESDQACKRADGSDWRCGSAATQALEHMISGGRVRCDVQDVDRYGRSVAICYSNGIDLNRSMTDQGFAIAYREYSQRYVPAELAARADARGIWATDFIDPADWRRRQSNE